MKDFFLLKSNVCKTKKNWYDYCKKVTFRHFLNTIVFLFFFQIESSHTELSDSQLVNMLCYAYKIWHLAKIIKDFDFYYIFQMQLLIRFDQQTLFIVNFQSRAQFNKSIYGSIYPFQKVVVVNQISQWTFILIYINGKTRI